MATAPINGTEIYYLAKGEGLPCLVMHGGLGLDHTYLYPWLNPLGDQLHLIYYDHRGNGRSGRPPKETMTHAQFAADADALAAHLGFDRVAVLGHSYGGFIALELALRHPERLSHLILADTAPRFDYGEEIMANAVRKGATDEIMAALQSDDYGGDEGMRQMLQTISPLYFKSFDEEIARSLMENTMFNAAGGAAEDELAAYNVTARLGEIAIPTLVLVGRDDFVCPPSQARVLHEGISGSELVIFEESGHFPYVEEPEPFFTAISDWLERTAGKS